MNNKDLLVKSQETLQVNEEYIKNQFIWLQNTLSEVGWNFHDLSKLTDNVENKDHIICPIISEHRMPSGSLDIHLIKCEEKNGDYPCVSREHILNLYSNVQPTDVSIFEANGKQNEPKSDSTSEKPNTSLALAELLEKERDAKRRRAAHRGKRVHSNKKSYNETLRELIANEMQLMSTEKMEENVDGTKPRKEKEKNVEKFAYLGVGNPYFEGNPHRRWLTIAEEEKEFENKYKSRDKYEFQDKKLSNREHCYKSRPRSRSKDNYYMCRSSSSRKNSYQSISQSEKEWENKARHANSTKSKYDSHYQSYSSKPDYEKRMKRTHSNDLQDEINLKRFTKGMKTQSSSDTSNQSSVEIKESMKCINLPNVESFGSAQTHRHKKKDKKKRRKKSNKKQRRSDSASSS